jgi:intergrase/recombinase
MAWRSPYNQPEKDTGWGLIFRLNDLMADIETAIDNGNLNKWDQKMDRIFCNIRFKESAEVIKDEAGKIVDVKLSKDDVETFNFLNREIGQKRVSMKGAYILKNFKEYHKAKNELYNLLMKKDIWLRKLMAELHLYLKEVEHDPRKAIYGG